MYALIVYAFMHMTFTDFHGLYLSQNLKKIPKPLRHIRLGKSRLYNYLLNRDSYANTNITMANFAFHFSATIIYVSKFEI